MGSLSSQSYTLLDFRCTSKDVHDLVEKKMRMISIGEVGGTHEHVLFMPTELLQNLIIMFVIGGSTSPAIIWMLFDYIIDH